MDAEVLHKIKTLSPKLRFKGFDVDWKIDSLTKLYTNIVVGFVGTITNDYCDKEIGVQFIRTLNVKDGWFSNAGLQYVTKEFHQKNKKSQVKNGDILIARVGANMGLVCEITGIIGEANSANVIIIKNQQNLSSSFYASYLTSPRGQKQIQSKGAGGAQEVLNISVAKTIKVPVLPFPEQQKIANFLSTVDEKIQQLTRKKELLEKYKKGVMQQIFSGKLRFKDEKGKEFSKWEEKRLGDVLDYIQPTKYLVTSTEYDDSYLTPVLTAGKTFILGYTNETNDIYNENLPVILFDDFTTATQFVDFPFKAKSSAMKILAPKEGEVIGYIYEAMRLIKFEIGGHGRHWISQYALLNIPYPCIEEQKKIADYLSNIDNKIESVTKQITQTQTFKKGLLQQMFV